jgi:hypothetical protein
VLLTVASTACPGASRNRRRGGCDFWSSNHPRTRWEARRGRRTQSSPVRILTASPACPCLKKIEIMETSCLAPTLDKLMIEICEQQGNNRECAFTVARRHRQ